MTAPREYVDFRQFMALDTLDSVSTFIFNFRARYYSQRAPGCSGGLLTRGAR
jgi:hypothetical protein